jgi:general secretion pathway protein L
MKISATEAGPAETALVFLDGENQAEAWLLLDGGEVSLRGEAGEPLPTPARAVLVVPGEQVAIHWLHLEEGLTQAQVAAAARLMLADASAEPLSEMHVAVGRPEGGRTPVALVPSRRMTEWLVAGGSIGLDPELVIPSTLLLAPPAEGFVRRERGELADYRAEGRAFSLEPELAEPLLAGLQAETIAQEAFEANLEALLADPPLNLRQGPFARRRQWKVEGGRMRRLALLALALIALTLAVQVTMILRYTFAADELEAEVASLSSGAAPGEGRDFSSVATVLFEAVRATPSTELTRFDYRADGTLSATVQADSPATLATLGQQIEASGLAITLDPPRNAGGRPTADLTVRPS